MIDVDTVVDGDQWLDGDNGGRGDQVVFDPPDVWRIVQCGNYGSFLEIGKVEGETMGGIT
jgi:hypothetical protein